VAVYATLFGIGKLIFGYVGTGLIMLVVAAAAFAWIARSFRMDEATPGPVGLPSEAYAAGD
jgi:hypothetical protein